MATVKRVSNGNTKRIVFGILLLALFGLMIFGIITAYSVQQREVEVVAFSHDISLGVMINESDIQPVSILQKEYDNKSKEQWTDANGVTSTGQIYVKWDDRADTKKGVVGKYLSDSAKANDYCLRRDITTDKIESNPWYSQVETGMEIYTLSMDLDDTYTKFILPGAVIRMRLVTEVDKAQEQAYRDAIANKAGTSDGIDVNNGFLSAVLPTYNVDSSKSSAKVPVSEIVFENLTIIDALNSSGQSIFDIYYALYNMESTAREQYIRSNASTLKSELMPEKLVLVLSTTEASQVAEFEQIGNTTAKFTVIKTETEDELYSKFNEIATRINQISLTNSNN